MTEEEKIQFDNQGFLHLRSIMDSNTVSRVRDKFLAAEEKTRVGWFELVKQGKASPSYFDIPNILDVDECFVDLVDHPRLISLLLWAVGADIQLNHTHARVFPPGKTFTALWHSDLETVLGIDLAHSPHFFVKVHFFFEDLEPDQGCLAFIPGSHRLPVGTPTPQIENIDNSSVVTKTVPRAGDVVVFNTHVRHMCLDNKSNIARKSLIYAYSHFWLKNYANSVPAQLEKYATNRLRKQLFGVEEEGVSYFDQRYDSNVTRVNFNSFQSASQRLMKRIRRATSVTWK